MVRRADNAKYALESTDRTVAVLSALADEPDQPLGEVARRAELNESTALRYLMSLVRHGLVEREPETGLFRLGLGLFRLGMQAIDQRDVVALARPRMEEIRDRFGESVNLASHLQGQILLLHICEGVKPFRLGSRIGETDHWNSTSLGKAVLAALPDAEFQELLSGLGFAAFTPNTLTDAESLARDIATVRQRGYAIDDEESNEGLRCVGAVVIDHDGSPRYALSVSGPKSRMPYARLDEIGAAVVDEARILSKALGAS